MISEIDKACEFELMQPRRSLTYFCLETPKEGQAAFTHVNEIIQGLENCGWQIDFVSSKSGGVATGSSLYRRILGYFFTQLRMLHFLTKSDGIYIRCHPAAMPIAIAAKIIRRPVFQELNGTPEDIVVTYKYLKPLRSFIEFAYRHQLKLASHVFVVTAGLRDWVQEACRHDNITIVPNGANTSLFNPDGHVADLGTRYVIFFGGLVAWHGIQTMLEALKCEAWPDDVQLVIVGDGIERRLLQAQSDEKKLNWLGFKSYQDLPPLIRGSIASLCVIESPSSRSAIGVAPIKLYEAMACGSAVIVTDLPHQAELVSEVEAGVVIPMHNPEALAEAVARLSSDIALAKKMGCQGARYVFTSASWQSRANLTSSVMAAVIDGNPPVFNGAGS